MLIGVATALIGMSLVFAWSLLRTAAKADEAAAIIRSREIEMQEVPERHLHIVRDEETG